MSRRRSLISSWLVVITLGAVAACSGSSTSESSRVVDTDMASTDTILETSAPPESSASTAAPIESSAIAWEKIDAPTDCMCADGSPFSYFVRPANPDQVVFYLEGGGACFSAEMCTPGSGMYSEGIDSRGVHWDQGIFDFDNPENPFADYSFVYVPYCTGDVHSGNVTKDYGNGVVTEHKGFVNASTALQTLVDRFPAASSILVAGSSAGAFTTPVFAGLVAEKLPTATVAVFADSGGAVPDAISVVTSNWGTIESLPNWPEFTGATASMINPSYIFSKVAEHNPAITFMRHDYAYDRVLTQYAVMAGISADGLVEVMRAGEKIIEASGTPLAAWVAAGDAHTIAGSPEMYTEEQNGVRFIDWMKAFLEGAPLPDQYCVTCVK